MTSHQSSSFHSTVSRWINDENYADGESDDAGLQSPSLNRIRQNLLAKRRNNRAYTVESELLTEEESQLRVQEGDDEVVGGTEHESYTEHDDNDEQSAEGESSSGASSDSFDDEPEASPTNVEQPKAASLATVAPAPLQQYASHSPAHRQQQRIRDQLMASPMSAEQTDETEEELDTVSAARQSRFRFGHLKLDDRKHKTSDGDKTYADHPVQQQQHQRSIADSDAAAVHVSDDEDAGAGEEQDGDEDGQQENDDADDDDDQDIVGELRNINRHSNHPRYDSHHWYTNSNNSTASAGDSIATSSSNSSRPTTVFVKPASVYQHPTRVSLSISDQLSYSQLGSPQSIGPTPIVTPAAAGRAKQLVQATPSRPLIISPAMPTEDDEEQEEETEQEEDNIPLSTAAPMPALPRQLSHTPESAPNSHQPSPRRKTPLKPGSTYRQRLNSSYNSNSAALPLSRTVSGSPTHSPTTKPVVPSHSPTLQPTDHRHNQNDDSDEEESHGHEEINNTTIQHRHHNRLTTSRSNNHKVMANSSTVGNAGSSGTNSSQASPQQHTLRLHGITTEKFVPSLFDGTATTITKKSKASRRRDEVDWGDIKVLELVGEGSFGMVYRGELYGQEVAIKQLRIKNSAASLADFEREVKTLRRLRHPNIVEFLAATFGANAAIITEFLPTSLEDLLKQRQKLGRKLSLKRIVTIAKDIARGLSWLHHKRTIHRDLKPANILLDSSGKSKLADFGLAHIKRRASSTVGHYGVVGTPVYCAPEVLAKKEYGTPADVFSFGMVLCELVVGGYPFADIGEQSTRNFEMAIINGMRPQLPQTHPDLQQILQSCWQDDPNQRPTIDQLMTALVALDQKLANGDSASAAVDFSRLNSPSHVFEELPDAVAEQITRLQKQLESQQAELQAAQSRIEQQKQELESEKLARERDRKLQAMLRATHDDRTQSHTPPSFSSTMSADLTKSQLLGLFHNSPSYSDDQDAYATIPGGRRALHRRGANALAVISQTPSSNSPASTKHSSADEDTAAAVASHTDQPSDNRHAVS